MLLINLESAHKGVNVTPALFLGHLCFKCCWLIMFKWFYARNRLLWRPKKVGLRTHWLWKEYTLPQGLFARCLGFISYNYEPTQERTNFLTHGPQWVLEFDREGRSRAEGWSVLVTRLIGEKTESRSCRCSCPSPSIQCASPVKNLKLNNQRKDTTESRCTCMHYFENVRQTTRHLCAPLNRNDSSSLQKGWGHKETTANGRHMVLGP